MEKHLSNEKKPSLLGDDEFYPSYEDYNNTPEFKKNLLVVSNIFCVQTYWGNDPF